MEGHLLALIHFARIINLPKKKILVVLLLFQTVACKNQNIAIDFFIPSHSETRSEKHVFLNISPEFQNYTYERPYEGSLEINLGSVQTTMFTMVLERIFTNVHLGTTDEVLGTIISPKLVNFELSKPKETGFEYYECRLEYSILIKTKEDSKKAKIFSYARLARSFSPENNIISKLITQCVRIVASKLEIELLK